MITTKGVVTGSLNGKQTLEGKVSTSMLYIYPNEVDPTVPEYVKEITEEDIDRWNSPPSGVHVGTKEPEDDNINVWINPDGTETINLATEEYVNEAIENAPGGVHVGTEEPEDQNIHVWINPEGTETINLATEEYVNEAIENAQLSVEDIPEHIKSITEEEIDKWNTPESSIHIGTDEPVSSFPNLWIDSDGTETVIIATEEYVDKAITEAIQNIEPTDIDLSEYYTKKEVDEKGYLTSFEETDPIFKASPSFNITNDDITNWNNKSEFSGSYDDLNNKPAIPTIPTDVSAFNNDIGYITSYTESDPTVPSHVKNISEDEISKWNSMRTIYTSTSLPSDSDGVNGDIWIVYEE